MKTFLMFAFMLAVAHAQPRQFVQEGKGNLFQVYTLTGSVKIDPLIPDSLFTGLYNHPGSIAPMADSIVLYPNRIPFPYYKIPFREIHREAVYSKYVREMYILRKSSHLMHRPTLLIPLIFLFYILYMMVVIFKNNHYVSLKKDGKPLWVILGFGAFVGALYFFYPNFYMSVPASLVSTFVLFCAILIFGAIAFAMLINLFLLHFLVPKTVNGMKVLYLLFPIQPLVLYASYFYTRNLMVAVFMLGGWLMAFFFALFLKHEKKPKATVANHPEELN